jgi:MFS family permease
VALTVLGALLAVLSTWAGGGVQLALLGVAACACGSGANMGHIAIQRTAGRSARDSVERMRMFSWLGLAPSFSNVLGPVLAGFVIDAAGFRTAYAVMLLLPLATLAGARRVPREGPAAPARGAAAASAWDLWKLPGLRQLMLVNWLLSTCWDVHTFAVPILGHERGFSASTIGLVLGTFPLAVTGVRLLIPLLAHRMNELQVLRVAMVGTGLVFGVYPLVPNAWLMGCCAVALGLTLGAVQPMIMSTLHHLTPEDRHGEAIAMRSMTMNASGALMPLLFGALGSTLGVAPLFWVAGAAVGLGSRVTRRLGSHVDAPSARG